ncbi:MAG TPA: multicopper oxidase domain-containing protein [Gemmatimonadales bacterium]|jgi:nitrite reductase (NO-forming)|nr:multicopper oxidase domain-containing protein [Gemmatimonadales bacterium]
MPDHPLDRRSFLTATTIATAMPLALAACRTERLTPGAAGAGAAAGTQAPDTTGADLPQFVRHDPELPPLTGGRVREVRLTATEQAVRISDDLVAQAWTFNGTVPGPVVRCRVGDTVTIKLTNEGDVPHSVDFHAAQIDPKTAFKTVLKGQTAEYTFTPKYAGAFLYHCGTQPVLMHMGMGMYGAIIVDPVTPLPPAREFVLLESEFYLAPPAGRPVRTFDYTQMLGTLPEIVAFNGYANQYLKEPIRVRRGERVRFYVVNAGPSHSCAFHIVGEQFDTVYLGAPPGNAIHGVQTFDVAAGGGMIFEFVADVPGEFPFVNHAFGHGQKGAIGVIAVGA